MKVQESPFSAKKTTSGRMLGCYILCSEILVEVNRIMVEVEVDRKQVKVKVDQQQVEVEVDRQQVKGRGSRPGKVEVEDIDDKLIDKRSKCGHDMTD
jgi:hypothetical protein